MTLKKQVKQQTPSYGICIDWETSGAAWGRDSSEEHQGIAFGAIVFSTADFSPVEELYCEIKFDPQNGLKWMGKPFKWSEEAAKIHGLTIEHLEEHGVTQEEAAVQLASLILNYFGANTGDKKVTVMFMGHNSDFDVRFTRQLLEPYGIMFEIHHVRLDTAGTSFINLGLFKSDLIFDILGFEERGEHNALEDARQTLQVCAIYRQLTSMAMETLKNAS